MLLVWGGHGEWMVVDEELAAFFELLDGRRTVRQAVKRHARSWDRPPQQVATIAGPVLEDLGRRGLLGRATGRSQRSNGPRIAISNLTVNLTNRCNLHCAFCYNDPRRGGELLAVTLLVQRLNEAAPVLSPDASLIILGGEPTLRPDRLLALVDGVAELLSEPVLLSSNGTLLTEALVSQLSSRNVEVQISIDSPNARGHDRLRGEGVFAKATAAARRLVAAGVPTILSMVYTADNIDALEPYLDLALSLGVNEARFIPLRLSGPAASGDHGRSPADQRVALNKLREIVARRPEVAPLLRRDFFSVCRATCQRSGSRRNCGIAERVALIDADGLVYPCPNHTQPDFVCGDLRQQSFAEIMTSSPVLQDIRARYDVQRYAGCSRCAFRSWCAGDCRGEVLAVTGDALGAAPHCAELKDVYLELLWELAS